MKAMILAAGKGTRLQPLTHSCPKALVEINGKPLLEIVIRQLIASGCSHIVVNVHHFAEQIIAFLAANHNFGISIDISDERELLRDTGGAIAHAAPLLQGTADILVCNVDIMTNLDHQAMFAHHQKSRALATLAIQPRPSSRCLLFDENLWLCGWQNTQTGETKTAFVASQPSVWAFSGIHIISPQLLSLLPTQPVFSIIDAYLALAHQRQHQIQGYPHTADWLIDVGKPESLAKAADYLSHELPPKNS